MNGPASIARLLAGYARANVQAALEYRVSFFSQSLAMLVNDVLWVVFWASYFDRFSLPGWTRADVVTLWAVIATSNGLALTFFGNATKLAGLITRGELDFFLALPKPVLLHTLISRMSLVAPGDVAFGILAFIVYRQPDLVAGGLFAMCAITGATIFVSFCVIVGSLAFWLGRIETTSNQLYFALINFSTFPTPIFQGTVKVLLYSVLPAAFVGAVPVELIKQPSVWLSAELIGASVVAAAIAQVVFRAGLARYTSGNLVVLRGE